MRSYKFASKHKIIKLKRQLFVKRPHISNRRQPPNRPGGAPGDDESNQFLLRDKVLDQSCAIGNELLGLLEPRDIDLLQGYVFGVFDSDFAQSTGDLPLL